MTSPAKNIQYRWVRAQDGIVAGVAKGMARTLGLDTTLVRLIWLIGLFCGVGIIAYFILAICLPREDRLEEAEQKKIAGVCLKLSRRLDMEVGLVRVLMTVAALSSLGVTILFYLILAYTLPKDETLA